MLIQIQELVSTARTAIDYSFQQSIFAGILVVVVLSIVLFMFLAGRASIKLAWKIYNDYKEVRKAENDERKRHRERLEKSFQTFEGEIIEIRTDVAKIETKVDNLDTRVERLERRN